MSSPLTGAGTILGTFQYMAPEQLEGQEADARTDIFAFGAVVYEMVTGKKAFEGKSQASLISAIMKDEPRPMSSLQPVSPAALDRVVKKCLAKEPDRRWQAASDLQDELQWIAEAGSQAGVAASAVAEPPRANWRRALPLTLGTSLVVAVVGGFVFWGLTGQSPQPVARFSIPLAADEAFTTPSSNYHVVAVSPDGSRIAYATNDTLSLRSLNQLEATLIPGTDGAITPFFSPDGQ